MTENERASMFREAVQSIDFSKIRCKAEDKKKSRNDKVEKFIDAYENNYRIPSDHEILKDHGVFFPRARSVSMSFYSSSGLHL